jgi:serine/threonine protein kinase
MWKPIWHRDVKPSNIFLAKPLPSSGIFVEWEPKLGGLDAAKFQYECPSDEPINAANDVYRLGETIHMLCTGRTPSMTYEMNERMYNLGLLDELAERPAPTASISKSEDDDSDVDMEDASAAEKDCNVPIPVNTPNEVLVELGLAPGEGGYSDVLEQLLKFTLGPDKKWRISAAKLHRVASTFYDCAALKASQQNSESVSEFQQYFADAVKEWGPEDVLEMALAKDDEKNAKNIDTDDEDIEGGGDEVDEDDDDDAMDVDAGNNRPQRPGVRWADEVGKSLVSYSSA